jgi:hypothetical protein
MLVVWEQHTWVLLYSPCSIYYVLIYLFVHSPSDKGFGSIKQMVRGSTFDPSKLLTPLLTYLTEETIPAFELSPYVKYRRFLPIVLPLKYSPRIIVFLFFFFFVKF